MSEAAAISCSHIHTEAIVADDIPSAVGPYSAAVSAGPFVFVSGQLPINPATGLFDGDNADVQAERALRNIGALLHAAELTMADVVKTTVLLRDIADFEDVNAVYAKAFQGCKVLPARVAFQVAALPRGAKVEIEAIACA